MRDWPEFTLEKVLDRLIDYRGISPKKSGLGVPVISARVVKSGRIMENIEQTIDPSYYKDWMRRGMPKSGDVVITTEGPLGEVAQLDEKTATYALGQRVVTLRGKPEILDNQFLKYLLISPEIQGRLYARATGSTVQGIKQKSLREMPIPVAPIHEQRKIASVLGALDSMIELNRKTTVTLEHMVQVIYKAWFVNFDPVVAKSEGRKPALMTDDVAALFPSELGPDNIPAGWAVGKLISRGVCTLAKPLSKVPAQDVYAYLPTANIHHNHISGFEEHSASNLPSRARMAWKNGRVFVARMKDSPKHFQTLGAHQGFWEQKLFSTGFVGFDPAPGYSA